MRSTAIVILAAVIVVFVALAFLPTLLARILDPRNMRLIRTRCEGLGLTDIEVKPWPNHYGVHFVRAGKEEYAKCMVKRGNIRWLANNPEHTAEASHV